MTHTQFSRPKWKYAACGLAVMALSGMALLGASIDAEAGYTCVYNTTQIGNNITMEVVATSGGPSFSCIGFKDTDTGPANISISGSLTSLQVGATTDNVEAHVRAIRKGLGHDFELACTHPLAGGPCSNTRSGFINGVDGVVCRIGNDFSGIPAPALPLVPVVITTSCIVNY